MIHPPETLRRQVESIKQLPTIPESMQRVMRVVTDPDSNASDLVKEIERDQSLTAKILRMVNSAFYGFYRQIASVQDAVVILGYNEIRILSLTISVFDTIGKSDSPWDRSGFWEHSLAVATATELLAPMCGMDPREAYVAGLLHDLGKVALDRILGHDWVNVIRMAAESGSRLPEIESTMLGLTHTDAGAMLAQRWHLPEGIAAAMRDHHHPDRGTANAPMAALVHVANILVKQEPIGVSGNPHIEPITPWTLSVLGLDPKSEVEVAERLRAKTRAMQAALHYV